MIDVRELRISNWIYEEGQNENKPFQIFSIYHELKNDKVNGLPICLMRPIPLTEEILLKCGFEKEEGTNEFTINGNTFTILKLRLGIDLRERFEFLSRYFNPNLDYVHQLQNLHFALTGEELNVNL